MNALHSPLVHRIGTRPIPILNILYVPYKIHSCLYFYLKIMPMISKHAHLENAVDTMTTKIKMYCNTFSNSLLYFLIVGGTLRCMETGSLIISIVFVFFQCLCPSVSSISSRMLDIPVKTGYNFCAAGQVDPHWFSMRFANFFLVMPICSYLHLNVQIVTTSKLNSI